MKTKYLGYGSLALWALCAFSAGSMVSTEVMADPAADTMDTGPGLDEVVVTARKRAEKLLDTPVSMSVLSAADIEAHGISSISDAVAQVPGLTIEQLSSGSARISIRGLQTDVGRSSVAILVDDVDITTESLNLSGSGYLLDMKMLDLDQVEVAKGPQAALYGRSAFGGAVDFITKRPSLTDTDVMASLDGTAEGQYNGRGSIALPLIEDKLAIRFTGSGWSDRGFYRNTVSGDYIGGDDGVGGALAILAKPTDKVSIFGNIEYRQERYQPRATVPIPGATTVNFSPAVAAAAGGAASGTFFGGPAPDIGSSSVALETDPATGRDYRGATPVTLGTTLNVDVDLGATRFRSLTGYFDQRTTDAQNNSFDPSPNPGGITPAFDSLEETFVLTRQDVLSQEFRLASNTSNAFQWMVGTLYWQESFGTPSTGSLFLPLAAVPDSVIRDAQPPARYPDGENTHFFSRSTRHYSGFFWTEYALNDRWSANVEARVAHEVIEYGQSGYIPVFLVLGPNLIINASSPPTPLSQASVASNYVTPKFTLRYKPNADMTLYGDIARGVKPAGYSSVSENYTAFNRYSPESLLSYELGSKNSLLNGTLSLNADVFFEDYRNQQVQFDELVVQPTGPPLEGEATVNAGKSQRYGAELEAAWKATQNLSLAVNYAYVHARFNSYQINSDDSGRIAEVGCSAIVYVAGTPECTLNYAGKTPGHVPAHQVNLTADWTQPINKDINYFGEVTGTYQSSRFLDDSDAATLPAFFRANLAAGVRWSGSEIRFYINNVFNEQKIADGESWFNYQSPSFSPDLLAFLAPPRVFGLRYIWHNR